MSKKLLQIDFPFSGPWGAAMDEALRPLAEDIAGEPGLIWKIWTADEAGSTAGGIYLFADQTSLDRYLVKHLARLASFGITETRAKCFDASETLTRITRGPV